jgi:hypothetical protein
MQMLKSCSHILGFTVVILQSGRWFAAFWRTILPPFSGIQTETGIASEIERVIV